jgi:hypothetical protein
VRPADAVAVGAWQFVADLLEAGAAGYPAAREGQRVLRRRRPRLLPESSMNPCCRRRECEDTTASRRTSTMLEVRGELSSSAAFVSKSDRGCIHKVCVTFSFSIKKLLKSASCVRVLRTKHELITKI